VWTLDESYLGIVEVRHGVGQPPGSTW
jgi:hypothetical protein